MPTGEKEFLKIGLIGKKGSGSSCFLLRYADDTFTSEPINSVGVDFKEKMLNIRGLDVKSQLWELSPENYKYPDSLNSIHIILLMLDLSKSDLELQKELVDGIHSAERATGEGTTIHVVGTKLDMTSTAEIQQSDRLKRIISDAYSSEDSFTSTVVSSKDSKNVDRAVEEAVCQYLSKNNLMPSLPPPAPIPVRPIYKQLAVSAWSVSVTAAVGATLAALPIFMSLDATGLMAAIGSYPYSGIASVVLLAVMVASLIVGSFLQSKSDTSLGFAPGGIFNPRGNNRNHDDLPRSNSI